MQLLSPIQAMLARGAAVPALRPGPITGTPRAAAADGRPEGA